MGDLRRLADDQGWSDAHGSGLFTDPALNPVDEDACCSCSHLITRLHNRGEMWVERAVDGEIIEGGQGDVLGTANVQFLEGFENAERHHSVAEEDRGWPPGGRFPATSGSEACLRYATKRSVRTSGKEMRKAVPALPDF